MKRTVLSKIDTGRGAGRLLPVSARPSTTLGVKASATSTKGTAVDGNNGSGTGLFISPCATSTPKLGVKRVITRDRKDSKDSLVAPLKRGPTTTTPTGVKGAAVTSKNGVPARTIQAYAKGSPAGGPLLRGALKNASDNSRKPIRKSLSNQDVNKLTDAMAKAPAFPPRNPNAEDGPGGAGTPETGFLPSRSVDSLTKVAKKSPTVSPNVGSVEFVASSTQTEEDDQDRWKNNPLRFRVHELEMELEDAVKDLVSAQVELEKIKDVKEAGRLPGSPIRTESKSTSFSLSPGEVRESLRDLAFDRNPVGFDVFGVDETESEEKLKELEEKYQEQTMDNLKLKAEIESKDKELNIWKEKCTELQDKLALEKMKVEKELNAMAEDQKDMLLVVQAAESYRLDAQREVKNVQEELASLKDEINTLEIKLHDTTCNPVRKRGVGVQVLLEDNKINKRDSCDPKENDSNPPIFSLPTNKSFPEHDGSDKENRSSNEETESEEKTPSITTNVKRTISAFGNSKMGELGSSGEQEEDPLVPFVKVSGGSKRNALLRWCQSRTVNYKFVDITNFSTSWSDGMALCALLHSYIPDKIQYDILCPDNNRKNFEIAMSAADSLSIPPTLNIDDIVNNERPSWENVMNYVKEIYLKLANCDSNPIPM